MIIGARRTHACGNLVILTYKPGLMVRYGKHALKRMAERQIESGWVELAIAMPNQTNPDPNDPSLTHSFRFIPVVGHVLKVFTAEKGRTISW